MNARAITAELRRAGRSDLAAAVQTFLTKQDELDERSRRHGKQGAFTGDIFEIQDEIRQLGGIYDPTAKVWLLRNEDEVAKLAKRHGYMLNWYARKGIWYLNAGVKIVGPKNITLKFRADFKRFHGRWDGKNWFVPMRQVNALRRFLEEKGVEFSHNPKGKKPGDAGVLTLKKQGKPPDERRQARPETVEEVYDLDAIMKMIDSIPKWPNSALLSKPKRADVAGWDLELFHRLLPRFYKAGAVKPEL